jgi:hypothetical protein
MDREGLRPGDDVAILLPEGSGTLHGRIARLETDGIAMAFRQNAETIALAEAFIARLPAMAKAA